MRDNKYDKEDFKDFNNKADKDEYGFWSKKLNKVFDSVEALKDAEKKDAEAKAAKDLAASERKADAQKVEDAYKKLSEITDARDEKVTALRKEYYKEQTALRKAYEAKVAAVEECVEAAEEAYTDALKNFTSKHGDFHTTFKDGEKTITISRSARHSDSFWDSILDLFLKI